MTTFPPPGVALELPRPVTPRPNARLIVFDLDGTISWLRHGWPLMMASVFRPHWPHNVPEAELNELLVREILALNGQPSIKQCERFVEMVREQGGPGLDGDVLRDEFSEKLNAAIDRRVESIRRGEATPGSYLVHGIYAFLQHAKSRGLELAILSTTVQERVEIEAELLGVRGFFGRHVYGGTGDPKLFSKRAVFERILEEERCPGAQLISFGDGPVELRETKALGGLAVGVCSDELENGSGHSDPHKREGLLAVGADAVMPDYRDAAMLLDHLLGK